MGRSAILLIGTEKTGTTTLQHFLAANRAALAGAAFSTRPSAARSTTPVSPPTPSPRRSATPSARLRRPR